MKVEVGKEYVYLGQWVKVIRIDADIEAVVETRFGERTTVEISELSEKHPG